MPRPKPKFSDYEYLFEGVKYTKPEEFIVNTGIRIQCEKGHEYILSVSNIKNQNKNPKICPYCERQKEYDKERIPYQFFSDFAEKYNFEVKIKKEFYSRWNDSIIFICKVCGEYEEEVKSLKYLEQTIDKKELKCEACKEKSKGLKRQEEYEKYIEEIVYKTPTVELKPSVDLNELTEAFRKKLVSQDRWVLVEYENTKNKAKFQCTQCGGIKETLPFNLFMGLNFNCLDCFKNKNRVRIYEEMRELCKKYNVYTVEKQFYTNVNDDILFKCNKCGAEFTKQWREKSYGFACKQCKRVKSKVELELLEYIKSVYPKEVIHNDRTVLKPFELDVYLPEENIAFEFCGGLWHSTKFIKDKYKHRNKYQSCEEKNIRLVTIFEDEWNDKKEICLSRIKNMLGTIETKVFARNGEVREIENSEALCFCDNNHIQGRGHAKESIGFFVNNELLSVMTFSAPSVSKHAEGYNWELNRFCSKKDTIVVGGANKMIKYFSEKHKGEIIVTFCDLRWGTGKIYETMGFEFIGKTAPNYYYIGEYTKWKRKHRFNFTKQRLIALFNETDVSLTEEEIAEKNGLYKIYDCGHLKYKKQL